MAALRHKYLTRDTIAYFPHSTDVHSAISIRWLEYMTSSEHVHIQHARNSGREATAGPFKVDGFSRDVHGVETCWEMKGCYWEGHDTCYPSRHAQRRKQEFKERHLRSLGYRVRTIWECEFRDMERRDPLYKAFLAQRGSLYTTPLNVREAFYGGRTNASRLYYKCLPAEKLEYVDFCSLYPFICKTGCYPIGVPQKLLFPSLAQLYARSYFGVAKVRVVPPHTLFHPVLPVRIRGKLMFPLCFTCARDETSQCTHGTAERSLEGVWCTPELYKAMDLGYEVSHVIEVHHFERSKTGLLSDYVDAFLRGKQEASGWPRDHMTQEQKDAYVRDYKDHEGIQLDAGQIEKNPGLRQVAKLMLTSLWGKFGQRGNQHKSKICDHPAELYAILFNERYEVVDMHMCPTNDQMIEVVYREVSEMMCQEPCNTNVYVAAFTTALARLRLLESLLILGDRVCYYDTDSIIYRTGVHDISLPIGMTFALGSLCSLRDGTVDAC